MCNITWVWPSSVPRPVCRSLPRPRVIFSYGFEQWRLLYIVLSVCASAIRFLRRRRSDPAYWCVRLSFVIRLSKHEYCQCRRQRLRFHERRELGQMERRTHHRLEEGKDRGRDCLGGPCVGIFRPPLFFFPNVIWSNARLATPHPSPVKFLKISLFIDFFAADGQVLTRTIPILRTRPHISIDFELNRSVL